MMFEKSEEGVQRRRRSGFSTGRPRKTKETWRLKFDFTRQSL